MKIKKITIVLMVPVIIELMIACCNCDDYPFNNYYEHHAFFSHSEMLAYSIDNSGPFSQLPLNDSVNANTYGIRIILDRQEVIPEENQQLALLRSVSLMQSAYAFSCYCPNEVFFEPADWIDSIHITTINEFDAFHPAGSEVSDYFLVLRWGDMVPLDQLPDYVINTPFDPEDKTLEINALLMNAPDPDLPENHAFNLEIYLSDGRILQTETEEITLAQ